MSFVPENRPYAFISVYDKQGLEPLARALSEVYGYGLISTGGTRAFLQERGVSCIDSETITGFGDLLEGRVKACIPIFSPPSSPNGAKRATRRDLRLMSSSSISIPLRALA